MAYLIPTVLSLENDRENTMRKTHEAKMFVEDVQAKTMSQLRKTFKLDEK